MALPHPSMNFVPLDTLTASELNQIVANILALSKGTGLDNSSVKPEHFDKLVWHDVSYENGFSALDSGGYQVPQYSKDAFGIVRLRGIAKHSQSNVTERIIFRLPVGFRPAGAEIFATPNASSVGRVNINPDGGVTLASLHNPSSSYVSLSGISFQAA